MLAARPPITVAVARFEDIIAVGLRALIEEDAKLALVATDVDSERMDATLGEHRPDVAILRFSALESPAELRELSGAHPATALLVLADCPSPAEARQVIGFGATACLARSTEARDIRHAIYLASRGLQVLPSAGLGEPPEAAAGLGPAPLTRREADVLELLQIGGSNAEIAARLHVGVETVRTHARHIYRKLGVGSRRELRTLA